MSEREQGTVVWFDPAKGYGFACPDGCDLAYKADHLFISGAMLKRCGIQTAPLSSGDRISFLKQEGRKCPGRFEVQDDVAPLN
jgi:cold shock protein